MSSDILYKVRRGFPNTRLIAAVPQGALIGFSKREQVHAYNLRNLQHRLGVDVLLRNGKLSTECSEPPDRSETPYPCFTITFGM